MCVHVHTCAKCGRERVANLITAVIISCYVTLKKVICDGFCFDYVVGCLTDYIIMYGREVIQLKLTYNWICIVLMHLCTVCVRC